jgi:hypothetical protein
MREDPGTMSDESDEQMARVSKMMDALEEQYRKPRFWWHGQNLKKEKDTMGHPWFYRRGWLHDRRSRFELGICGIIPSRFLHAYIQFGDEHQITVSIACWLFALWVHVGGIRALRHRKLFSGRWGTEREIKLSVFEWALSWRLWVDPMSSSSRTPKWRDGYLHFGDLLLGKRKYTCEYGEWHDATCEMPEGSYTTRVRTMLQEWKRPRWPWPRVRGGYDIEIPGGVPIPGKGENSWDCGEDAVMATGSNAPTIEEAMKELAASVMETRKRYGGDDWRPAPARSV